MPGARAERALATAGLALALTGCASLPDAPEVDAPTATHEPTGIAAPMLSPTIDAPLRTHYVDVFARIRAGYGLDPVVHEHVDDQLDWLRSHPRYLERAGERAAPWLHHVVSELDRHGLPLELALLPIVESGFDPRARSHRGAAGLWQFVRGTGAAYGLDRDWWHDERSDPLEATRAAIEHLTKLHQRFDEDWLLALAAYNSGSGTVARARRRAGPDAGFFDLSLPRETRAYVPRLLAISRIVAEPTRYGVTLPALADAPAFAVVETGGQLDLGRAAELAGIDERTVRRLNPQLARFATHPEGPHRLLVPVEAEQRLRDAVAELDPTERLRWHRHQIRPGDTLSEIAQRYGIATAALRRANGIRGSRIRAGDALMVPLPTSTAARTVTYEVRRGDSYWRIADRFGVAMDDLLSWNALDTSTVLRPGQRLELRVPTTGR